MEMPGVEKKDLDAGLENDVLRVDGRIDFSKYEGMEPLYTEYNVGHYTRSFGLWSKIDRDGISAQLAMAVGRNGPAKVSSHHLRQRPSVRRSMPSSFDRRCTRSGVAPCRIAVASVTTVAR